MAFNNHAGSTKAYDFVRAHNEAVNRLDIIEPREAITVEYAPGTTEEVALHDGSSSSLPNCMPITIRTIASRRWPICKAVPRRANSSPA